jgi:hypothetical protein
VKSQAIGIFDVYRDIAKAFPETRHVIVETPEERRTRDLVGVVMGLIYAFVGGRFWHGSLRYGDSQLGWTAAILFFGGIVMTVLAAYRLVRLTRR